MPTCWANAQKYLLGPSYCTFCDTSVKILRFTNVLKWNHFDNATRDARIKIILCIINLCNHLTRAKGYTIKMKKVLW